MNSKDITDNINNPKELEKLYQENKSAFKKEFNLIYPELTDNTLAAYWNERLNYESNDISWGSKNELTFVIIAALLAGVIAKLPVLLHSNLESFYTRNIGFIVLPILTVYFAWRNNLNPKRILFTSMMWVAAIIFINTLPYSHKSDTLILSCIHLPLILWVLLGISYVGTNVNNNEKRLSFLRYNGDLVIISTLITIAGGMLTGLTIGLFSIIGFNISEFYFNYVVIFGAAAVPVIGTFITQNNPQLVNKISPLIAKVFTPLVLVTLVVYLAAILVAGKDPYKDREFLMAFNLLLIGVMAIILFSVAESSGKKESKRCRPVARCCPDQWSRRLRE